MRKRLLVLMIIIYNQFCYTQESSNKVNQQFRVDYNSSKKLTEKLNLFIPVGYRITSSKKWSRLYVEPQIKYDWPRLILKKRDLKKAWLEV